MAVVIYRGKVGSGLEYQKLQEGNTNTPDEDIVRLEEGASCKRPDGRKYDNTLMDRPLCAEGLCCGSARKAGSDVSTSIEICYTATAVSYPYKTDEQAEADIWQFACVNDKAS